MLELPFPTYDQDALSRFNQRLDIEAGISLAGTKYEHTTVGDRLFFPENEKTFLSVVCVPGNASRRSQHRLGRSTKRSRLEALPYEIPLCILELLHISSLVAAASVNTYVQNSVQGLPDLKKVQQSIYSARALSRMYTSGTTKHFTLNHSISAIVSKSCALCTKSYGWVVSICLMRCRSICPDCECSEIFRRFVPIEMAMNCFCLTHEEIGASNEIARVPTPPAVQHKPL
jgi:hypothetical protein